MAKRAAYLIIFPDRAEVQIEEDHPAAQGGNVKYGVAVTDPSALSLAQSAFDAAAKLNKAVIERPEPEPTA